MLLRFFLPLGKYRAFRNFQHWPHLIIFLSGTCSLSPGLGRQPHLPCVCRPCHFPLLSLPRKGLARATASRPPSPNPLPGARLGLADSASLPPETVGAGTRIVS